MVQRRGQQGFHRIQTGFAALVLQGGADQHRGQLAAEHALAQAGLQVFQREAAFLQIFFHQDFIAFRDIFHGDVAQQAHVVQQVGGNFRFADRAVFAEDEGFACQHVHHARESLALADGQLQGHGFDAQGRQTVKGHVKIGPVAVQLVDDDHGRQAFRADHAPEFFAQGAHAVHGVQHEEHAVHALEQAFHIAGEVAVAGNVQQEMAVLVPEIGGAGRLHRTAAAHFLGFVVEVGGAVFNGAHAGHGPGVEQQHFGQRRFAAAAGADESESALHFQRGWHGFLP